MRLPRMPRLRLWALLALIAMVAVLLAFLRASRGIDATDAGRIAVNKLALDLSKDYPGSPNIWRSTRWRRDRGSIGGVRCEAACRG